MIIRRYRRRRWPKYGYPFGGWLDGVNSAMKPPTPVLTTTATLATPGSTMTNGAGAGTIEKIAIVGAVAAGGYLLYKHFRKAR